MGRSPSVTLVGQLQRQLGVSFYSTWYYIWPGVGILARKSGLALNMHALSGSQYYFLNVILYRFYVFWKSKSQGIPGTPPPEPPPGPCNIPTRGLAAHLRSQLLFALRVSCSYNLGAFGATDFGFFSVLTPGLIIYLGKWWNACNRII